MDDSLTDWLSAASTTRQEPANRLIYSVSCAAPVVADSIPFYDLVSSS